MFKQAQITVLSDRAVLQYGSDASWFEFILYTSGNYNYLSNAFRKYAKPNILF